ncbi:MAG: pyridoxal-phosphate dependent enzyme [Anaerolineaceae bacterium]
MTDALPISFSDVLAGAARLRGKARKTPVMTSRTVDELTGASVFFKCENFQRGGAFKFRGAYNFVASLEPEVRAKGVLAISSGNHAQGVALAAREFGIPATIIMPDDAPHSKLDATLGYGATVVRYPRLTEHPDDAVKRVLGDRDVNFIPAFDHPWIMAGQGTAALELMDEVGDLDVFIAPTGGGGLLAGSATAVRHRCPGARIIGVEPEVANDWVLSLRKGERVQIDPPPTIADGVRTRMPGVNNFAQVRATVDDVLTVSEGEIRAAVRFLVQRMKIVVEPTGAIPVAMLFSGRLGDIRGKRIGLVISGGNVDADVLCDILTESNGSGD